MNKCTKVVLKQDNSDRINSLRRRIEVLEDRQERYGMVMIEVREDLHPAVIAMANAMQEKLVKNAYKDECVEANKGKCGWKQPDCDVGFLIRKLNEETRELRYAARRDNMHMTSRLNDVRLEAADVANIAMMIADNLGAYDEH